MKSNSPYEGNPMYYVYFFSYLCFVLLTVSSIDIHNTGKCLALFSGNESDNSQQVENKLIPFVLNRRGLLLIYTWGLCQSLLP